MELVKQFLELSESDRTDYYVTKVINKCLMKEFHKNFIKYCNIKDKQNKRYYYLITFTLSDDHKDYDPKVVNKYIISRLAGSGLQVEKAHLVQELTEQGRPHWHASVIAKKYISQDRFKYYVNKFGIVDISKNHSQNYDTMLKYISKSNIPKQIIGGL